MRVPIWLVLPLAVVVGLAVAFPAEAARVALVIGNQDYAHLPKLEKSVRDAEAYAALFRSLGFDNVLLKENVTRDGIEDAMSDFVDATHPGDTAVFVYSGQSWSLNGQDYLVGTDAPEQGSAYLLTHRSEPIGNGVDGILDAMDATSAQLKVAIIDACRGNPFATQDGAISIGDQGCSATINPSKGTFLIFSAGAGETALDRLSPDDKNPNSVFTRTFLPLLSSNPSLLDAVQEARAKVYELGQAVNHDQNPVFYDETLADEACLAAQCGEDVTDPTAVMSAPSADSRARPSATLPAIPAAVVPRGGDVR